MKCKQGYPASLVMFKAAWMWCKHGGSDAAITDSVHFFLSSSYWEKNEHLYRPTPAYVPLKATNYSWKFGLMHQDTP